MVAEKMKIGISSGNHGTIVKWINVDWSAVLTEDETDNLVRIKSECLNYEVTIFRSNIKNKRLLDRFYVVMFDLIKGYSQANLMTKTDLKDMLGEKTYLDVICVLYE